MPTTIPIPEDALTADSFEMLVEWAEAQAEDRREYGDGHDE